MSHSNAAVPPQPKNRGKTGQTKRQRNEKGQFVKGTSGNKAGRPKLREEFKIFAQEKSIDALRMVHSILTSGETSNKDRLTAARLLMEYGYGRPAAELDRERLDLDRSRLEFERKRAEAAEKQDAVPIQIEWDGAEDLAE